MEDQVVKYIGESAPIILCTIIFLFFLNDDTLAETQNKLDKVMIGLFSDFLLDFAQEMTKNAVNTSIRDKVCRVVCYSSLLLLPFRNQFLCFLNFFLRNLYRIVFFQVRRKIFLNVLLNGIQRVPRISLLLYFHPCYYSLSVFFGCLNLIVFTFP